MRARLLATMLIIGLPVIAAAESSFVAVVNILNAKGEFERGVLPETSQGVSRAECDLRRDAWLARNQATIDATNAKLKSEGKEAAISVTCQAR